MQISRGRNFEVIQGTVEELFPPQHDDHCVKWRWRKFLAETYGLRLVKDKNNRTQLEPLDV